MRRSIRGSSMSICSSGAVTRSRACETCNSPSRPRVSNGSPPACCPGSPRTLQRPPASRCRTRSSPRTRSSVNERPGSRPAYCATRISASPIRSASAPAPIRRLSSRSSGPRRVHSVCTASNATGRCARALSQRAISSGWRSATGSSWLARPLPSAISTSAAAPSDSCDALPAGDARGWRGRALQSTAFTRVGPPIRAGPRRTAPGGTGHPPGSGSTCPGIPPARRPRSIPPR